jgi:outer membrane protein assembly factor BamB
MKNRLRTSWKEIAYLSVVAVVVLPLWGVSQDLSSCEWAQCYTNEGHTSHADTNIVPPLALLWKESPEYEIFGIGTVSGSVSGSPIVCGDRLVLISRPFTSSSSRDCFLLCYALRESGLQLVWYQSLPEAYSDKSPAIAGDKVICPSDLGLHCFDLEKGEPLWEARFGYSVEAPTIVRDANAAIAVTRGGLSLVSISTGEILWTITSLEGTRCQFEEIATAGDDKIFVYYSCPDEDGIAAFNLEGALLWKRQVSLLRKYSDALGTYVTLCTEGSLFVVDERMTLHALNVETGDTIWTYGKGFLDALSSDGKSLYVYKGDGEAAVCLDIATGNEVWESQALFPEEWPKIVIDKSMVSTGNCIFICHYSPLIPDSAIVALDSRTGELLWRSEEIEGLRGPSVIWKNMIIVATSGSLLSYGIEDRGLSESIEPESALNTYPPQTKSSGFPRKPSTWYYLVLAAGVAAGILTICVIKLRRDR